MQIQLDQIRGEPFVWRETVTIPPAALERPELVELSDIEWSGRILPADPGYFLTARFRYQQTLACTRCLEPLREQVDEQIELLLLVEPGAEGERPEGERELAEEELGILILAEERVDTRPLLLEQLQLQIPMKPLCEPGCRGLCPRCGVNLNSGGCSCGEVAADPRWAALAGLKDHLKPD